MRQTENIFGGKLPWVDRRTGSPDHSPLWDDNAPKTARKDTSVQYAREPGVFFMWQSAILAFLATFAIFGGWTWWILPLWFILFVAIMILCHVKYVGTLIFSAMSLFYGWCAFHLLTTFMIGPLWAGAFAIAVTIITFLIQRGSMQEVQT